MKKIENFEGRAPKISTEGDICYHLWISQSGALYVQMYDNDIETHSPGTLNNYLFPVSSFIGQRHLSEKMRVPEGVSIKTGENIPVKNNNTSAFLKAVLRDLYP